MKPRQQPGAPEWQSQQVPNASRPGAVTLVEGAAFCVSMPSGDILPNNAEGMFFRDTRLVSRWELRVDGRPVEPLAVLPDRPFCATFLGRSAPRPGRAESTVLITRSRYVGAGMREDIAVYNFAQEPVGLQLALWIECDLAGIFEVKGRGAREHRQRTVEAASDSLVISSRLLDGLRGTRVSAEGSLVSPSGLSFLVVARPGEVWRSTVFAQPIIDGQVLAPRFPADQPIEAADPMLRMREWQRERPTATVSDAALADTLRRSLIDLGSLRIFDSCHPEQPPSIAAGAPWFMSVFGRDSLLASHMALPLDQSLVEGTVRVLAGHQGEREDALSEEEPGKIIHELRHGEHLTGASHGSGKSAYYGSVDATPLFVMMVGELWRWGRLDERAAEELLIHADRGLQWIERHGDLDGDGFVEYCRKTDRGLFNQGWKDSADGVNFADGSLAQPPIALAEVQAYVYGAYLARAHIAREQGDARTAERYSGRAAHLKRAFNEAFWLKEKGWYAVGLDREKRPIDALASNMGHCLLTGLADADKAESMVEQFMSPQMYSGWGIRTLGTSMRAYNPMSYHNGSVWPHDNAIIVAGLMRYGFVEEAQRVALDLLDAAEAFEGQLPELFCGFDRAQYTQPIPYPTSCAPQAWASATPIHLLRTLMRFDVCIPCGKIWLAPQLPTRLGEVRVERLSVADHSVSIRAYGTQAEVSGLPPGIELVRAPQADLAPEQH